MLPGWSEDALCRELRSVIAEKLGQDVANKTILYYRKGWYYYNLASRFQDGSVGVVGVSKGMRAWQIKREIEYWRNRMDEQERNK
jgi:hypothetical protein